jgi:hypothetical protein
MIRTLRCIPTSFAPANAAAWLTGIAERISKSETFGSAVIGQFEAALLRQAKPVPRADSVQKRLFQLSKIPHGTR